MTKSLFLEILEDNRGATAVEYGLLAGLIALAAVTGITGFGSEVSKMWSKVGTTIANATNA